MLEFQLYHEQSPIFINSLNVTDVSVGELWLGGDEWLPLATITVNENGETKRHTVIDSDRSAKASIENEQKKVSR